MAPPAAGPVGTVRAVVGRGHGELAVGGGAKKRLYGFLDTAFQLPELRGVHRVRAALVGIDSGPQREDLTLHREGAGSSALQPPPGEPDIERDLELPPAQHVAQLDTFIGVS